MDEGQIRRRRSGRFSEVAERFPEYGGTTQLTRGGLAYLLQTKRPSVDGLMQMNEMSEVLLRC